MDEVEGVWQLMLAFNRPALATVLQHATSRGAAEAPALPAGAPVGQHPVVITASHFLPSPQLPFNRFGCVALPGCCVAPKGELLSGQRGRHACLGACPAAGLRRWPRRSGAWS